MPLSADLGAQTPDVHAKSREVLGFWFDLLMPEQWFRGSSSTDDEIRELFGTLRDHVLTTGAEGWREYPETMLAAIILLDQFSRNIHRGTAQAFEADPLALELACEMLYNRWDADLTKAQRQFVYMPLMHAEDMEMQALSLKYFQALGDKLNLKFARDHAAVIEEFGRFPSRNDALGRESTEAEKVYLAKPGAGW